MEEDNKDIFGKIILGGIILFIIWLIFFSGNSNEQQYIHREFNNGKVINMEVDREITRDNWECTEDCSGHDAGYNWAEENGISDPSDCGGNSESFIEGCEAYANEY